MNLSISENEALEKGLKEKSTEWSELGSRDIDGQPERARMRAAFESMEPSGDEAT